MGDASAVATQSSPARPTDPICPPADDPERQPLIGTGELNRRSVFYPVIVGVVVVIGFGLVVGFGGWRLGMGEGGRRWPGGPH